MDGTSLLEYRAGARRLCVLAVLLLAAAPVCAGQRYALLVGVSHYPNLGEKYRLHGPTNDVALLQSLLVEKFSFADTPDSIHVLSEREGESDKARLPTYANIRSAFEELAGKVDADDDVVIFIAGHGSQQPEMGDGPYAEADGLDEIFLPRDVARWSGQGSQVAVPNAITDDQFAKWFAAIRAKHARLWVIFDCCHSGDLARGPGEDVRFVDPHDEDGLNIPADEFQRAGEASTDPTGQSKATSKIDTVDQSRMAVFYACESNEKTIERPFPSESDAPHYGLLTYSLGAVLSKADAPLSYEGLGRRLHQEYIRLGRPHGPTPLVEGGDIKRIVLGSDHLQRSPLLLHQDRRTGSLHVSAGTLHGLTVDSVLAVYAGPGDATPKYDSPPVGYVQVADTDTTNSSVTPIAFGETKKKSRRLLVGGRCEVVQHSYADLAIQLTVDERGVSGEAISADQRREVLGHLERMAESAGPLLRIAAEAHVADWFVRRDDARVVLVPAERWSQFGESSQPGESPPAILGPFPINDQLSDALLDSFRTIVRCRNLIKLAATSAGSDASDIDVRVAVRNLTSGDSKSPVSAGDGESLKYEITNLGSCAVDVSLLAADRGYGVTNLYPIEGELNRFHPDDSRSFVIDVDGSMPGREMVVVIAVEGLKGQQPVNFSALEQPTITRYRGKGPAGVQSPLQQLVETALYGSGTTRSLPSHLQRKVAFQVIPVDIVKGD